MRKVKRIPKEGSIVLYKAAHRGEPMDRVGRLGPGAESCYDSYGQMVFVTRVHLSDEERQREPRGIISREQIIKRLTAQEVFDYFASLPIRLTSQASGLKLIHKSA